MVLQLLMVSLLTLFSPPQQQIGCPSGVQRADNDELLVLVTTFNGDNGVTARNQITTGLLERAQDAGLEEVRIEQIEPSVRVDQQADATQLGNRCNATIVIWGNVSPDNLEPRYQVIENSQYVQDLVDVPLYPGDDETLFEAFLLNDAPEEFEYLMLFSIGQLQYFTGNYAGAVASFSDALLTDLGDREQDFDLPTVYGYRSVSYYGLNDTEASLADLATVIELEPENPIAYINRSVYYLQSGLTDLARADLERALALDPEDDRVRGLIFINRAVASVAEGNQEAAFADLDTALELDPDAPEAYNTLGNIYLNQQDFSTALDTFDTALELRPDNSILHNNRATALYGLMQYDRALVAVNTALDINPDFALAYSNRANILIPLGDTDGAAQDVEQALALDDSLPLAYNARANLSFLDGDVDGAIADLTTAITLDPAFATAYINRGNMYAQQGDYDAALRDYETALSLLPPGPQQDTVRIFILAIEFLR